MTAPKKVRAWIARDNLALFKTLPASAAWVPIWRVRPIKTHYVRVEIRPVPKPRARRKA